MTIANSIIYPWVDAPTHDGLWWVFYSGNMSEVPLSVRFVDGQPMVRSTFSWESATALKGFQWLYQEPPTPPPA